MVQSLKTIRWGWTLFALIPLVICFIPFLFLVFGATNVNSTELSKSFAFFSIDSISNTIILCLGVLVLSCILGIGLAYLVVNYSFKGSRFFEIAFYLPIAIPGYIMAITYSSFFDYGGYFYQFTGSYLNIMNMAGLIFVLSISLFPYIYITALHAFKLNSANYNESAKLLGASSRKLFFKITLPLAAPAIIGGVWLTLMETLNDFGAASYFGIRTISTEIFRCWQFGTSLTLFLSFCIMLFILLLMVIMQYYLNKKRHNLSSKNKKMEPIKVNKKKSWLYFGICLFVLSIVFLIPVVVLIAYAIRNGTSEEFGTLIIRSYNSFQLAGFASLFIIFFCIISAYFKIIRNKKSKLIGNIFLDFGYAIPGSVLAVSILSLAAFIDTTFSLFLTGTVFFLIMAYFIRFYTVARQPIENIFNKLPSNLYGASLSLGKSPFQSFIKIYLPLLLPGFLAIFLLVFIDILKELPLTLILRPYNFNSLSTTVYGYAKVNENIGQASLYCLFIITLGVLAIFMLKHIERKYGTS